MALSASPIDTPQPGVLAWPRDLQLNPMVGTVHDNLERVFGWRVAAFSVWRALLTRYRILHISFPNAIFRNPSKIVTLTRYGLARISIRAAKITGRRVVWTVHNLSDHESYHAALEARFMRRFIADVDFVVHLSERGREAVISHYPALAHKPYAIVPHPHYRDTMSPPVARDSALAALGLPADCRLVLAFGTVRRYKNLVTLIRAFNDLPESNTLLLVAGLAEDKRLVEALRKAAGARVILALRRIQGAEIATLFGAASLVVASYSDILNSGTAFLSLSYARPILLPGRGAMADLQDQVGPDWVKLFNVPLTSLVIRDALQWAAAPRDSEPDLTTFAPVRVAEAYHRNLSALI